MIMLSGTGVLFALYPPPRNLVLLLPFVLVLVGFYLWKLADGGLAARELEPEKLLLEHSVRFAAIALIFLAAMLATIPYDPTIHLGLFSHD